MQNCEKAQTIATETQTAIELWKRTACGIINDWIGKLTEAREKFTQELSDLQAELSNAFEIGLQEAQKHLYSPKPVIGSPFGKVLFGRDSVVVPPCTLRTDFEAWKQSFEQFLFSTDVCLQLEWPDFTPIGLIKTTTDIDLTRKVNIYLPVPKPFYTEESRQVHSQCRPYPLRSDATPLLRRGPVSDSRNNIYIGQWSASNKSHGVGQLFQRDGGVYEGQFKQDEFSGKGRFISKEGTLWTCEWEKHECSRFGVRRELSGETYTGEFKNDKSEGYGFTQYAATSQAICYFGEYSGDLPQGRGAFLYKNGYMHLGSFKRGKTHGKGLCRGTDNSLYYGDFAEGDMSGVGVWLLPDGRVYRGEIQQDLMWGKGKMQNPGEEYEGEWEAGELKGSEEASEGSSTPRKRKPNTP